ncbi:MAG: hypothetical protein ACFFCQ_10120 [Promethearchaeota archaeon]
MSLWDAFTFLKTNPTSLGDNLIVPLTLTAEERAVQDRRSNR